MIPSLLAWLVPAFGAAAHACSLAAPIPWETDTSLADGVLPEAPGVGTVEITRGRGPRFGGMSTSCDDLGLVRIEVEQPDGAAVGYRLALVDGHLPHGLGIDGVVAGPDVFLHWIDGAENDQEPIAFTLGIRAVDDGGEEGPEVEVAVEDGGSGCDASGGRPMLAGALLAALSAWTRRTRSAGPRKAESGTREPLDRPGRVHARASGRA